MEISDKNPSMDVSNLVQDIQQDKPAGKPGPSEQSPAKKEDVKVNLSSQSQEISRLKNEMASVPDVRSDKVNELKNQVVNGTYKVDGNLVALNMIKESILDEIA